MTPRLLRRDVVNGSLVSFGVLVGTLSAFSWGVSDGLRTVVDPSIYAASGPLRSSYPQSDHVVNVAILAFAALLVSGLPRPRAATPAPHPLWGHVTGGVLLGGAGLGGAWISSLFFFADAGDGCARSMCSPLPEQVALILAPCLVLAAVLVAIGATGRPRRWWVRTVIPPAVLIGLAILQAAAWDSVILPYLESANG